ncbi:MAG: hypothetical protein Q9200_004361 [Gallowayella weberi]
MEVKHSNNIFAFDQIDDASAALILRLQREDAEELQSLDKGKGCEGTVSDADFALQVYQHELQQTSTVLIDRCMSRSLAKAVMADSAFMTDAVAREDAFAHDRLVAERLHSGEEVDCSTDGCSEVPQLDDLFIARLTALYVSGTGDDCTSSVDEYQDTTTGESSQWAAARADTSKTTRHECVACSEHKRPFESFQTPCGHYYCVKCLVQLFELSTTDETLFPPRCCRQGISLTSARLYLGSELYQRFQKKSVEFQTGDRTYCSRPTCSAFITPANIVGERATCAACFTETCTICKGNSHDGDCPQDAATQEVLQAAAEQGWQRCYNCRRMVELSHGCNHITYIFCTFSDQIAANFHPAVLVAPNSATSVEYVGKIAGAINGTKTVSWLGQNKLWHVTNRKEFCPPSWNISWTTSVIGIIVPTITGAMFGDPVSVRSVITSSPGISSNAGNARSGLAIAVGETDCEKPE